MAKFTRMMGGACAILTVILVFSQLFALLTRHSHEFTQLDDSEGKAAATTFATLVTQSKMDELRNLVASLHKYSQSPPSMIIYGVNLKREHRFEIKSWVNVRFIDVSHLNYETDWTIEELLGLGGNDDEEISEHNHGTALIPKWYHFWQMVVVRDATFRVNTNVLTFIDTSFQFIGDPQALGDHIHARGYLFLGSHRRGCSSLVQGMMLQGSVVDEVITPLANCALDRICFEDLWRKNSKKFRLLRTGYDSHFKCTDVKHAKSQLNIKRSEHDDPSLETYIQTRNFTLGTSRSSHLSDHHKTPTVIKEDDKSGKTKPEKKPEETKPTEPQDLGDPNDSSALEIRGSVKMDGVDTIALLVPTTSKNVRQRNPKDTPLFTILLASIKKTFNKDDKRFRLVIYIGFDENDEMFDSVSKQQDLKKLTIDFMKGWNFDYRSQRFVGAQGAPCWIWNGLASQAHREGADYMFQLNDDIQFQTPNWAGTLVGMLTGNKLLPNFGATAPLDNGNRRTMTQSFVHRTHLDIFDSFYPVSFKNWYSDDWITHVYRDHTFRDNPIECRNMNPSGTRYNPAHEARHFLSEELAKGCTHIKEWLVNTHPESEAAKTWECGKKDYWWELERRRLLMISKFEEEIHYDLHDTRKFLSGKILRDR